MYINEYWTQFSRVSRFWHYLNAATYGSIGFLALLANLMVLYFLLRIKKNTRPEGNYFLINLAIGDIFKVIIAFPMNVISSIKGEWIFGQIGCDLYGFAGGLFGFVSLSTLVFMSIERFLIVKSPLNVLKFSCKSKFVCILFTWIYAALLISLQYFSEHGFVLEGMLTSCSWDYISRDVFTRTYMLIMFVFGFVIPLILIIVFYALTRMALKSRGKFIQQELYSLNKTIAFESALGQTEKDSDENESMLPATASEFNIRKVKLNATRQHSSNCRSYDSNRSVRFDDGLGSSNLSQKRNYGSLLKRENRVLKRIILNVSLFGFAWMPYAIVTLYAQFGNDITMFVNPYTASLPAVLAKTSSIYNPILYTLSNRECQAFFRGLFKRT